MRILLGNKRIIAITAIEYLAKRSPSSQSRPGNFKPKRETASAE
jgi:hypothetical protein